MAYQKGRPKTGGRQKGVVNKTPIKVKEALAAAFDELGGIAALVKWGRGEPGEFYRIWAKMLPREIGGVDGTPIQVDHVELTIEERRARLAELLDKIPIIEGENNDDE